MGSIAARWTRVAHEHQDWVEAENQAGVLDVPGPGEAGGLYVTCSEFPRRFYMKPRRTDPSRLNARAAREKIAADLAYELGANVPPVVLTQRFDCGDEEPYVAASLVVFPAQYSWAVTKLLLADESEAGEAIREVLPIAASRGLVLDAWLDQLDHAESQAHNIIFGYDPRDEGRKALIMLDFSMSMGLQGRWEGSGYKREDLPAYPSGLVPFLQLDALKECIYAVENMEESLVEGIVDRIPDTHMLADQRRLLRDGLLYRQRRVRRIVSQLIPEVRT